MIKKIIATLLLSCSSLVCFAEDVCQVPNPSEFTKQVINEKVLSVLNTYKATLKENPQPAIQQIELNLKPYINIALMSTYVVQPAVWKAASPEDQAHFNDVFYDFIGSVYGSAVKSFQNNGFEFMRMRGESWKISERVMVYSTITNPDGSPGVPVSYVLGRSGCDWKFLDFVVEGSISAVQNIQQQIQSIIQQEQAANGGQAVQLSAITKVISDHLQKSAS
jgi:ABC-type transporter MlaC component